jgi:hypothetical protein
VSLRSIGFLLPLLVVSLLCGCVVMQAPALNERPRWRLDGDARFEGDCVHGRAYIRKSGKQGVGITLELRSTSDCTIEVPRVHLWWADGTSEPRPGIAPLVLHGHSLAYAWLPVDFDNDAAWNGGRDTARVEVDVVVAGRSERWRIPMRQR